MHRETYRVFWRWSDNNVARAMAWNSLQTSFGWQLHVPTEPNVRSLANFPMESTGAEMLRLACCLGTERSVELCGPVHDAVLVCARLDRLDADIECMREAMDEASRIVLDGFEIGMRCMLSATPTATWIVAAKSCGSGPCDCST